MINVKTNIGGSMGTSHRSAMGKTVDMAVLGIANEETIAVGNMNVNARGDELGAGGQIVRTVNDRLKEHYNNVNTQRPTDGVVHENADSATPKIVPDPVVTPAVSKRSPKVKTTNEGNL